MAVAMASRPPPLLGLMLALMVALALAPGCFSAPLQEQQQQQHHHVAEYYGESGCYYNFQHYEEGDRIITNEPCLNCTCHNRMLMCYLRVCPFTKAIGQDCTIEKKPEQCCPIITCPEVPVQLVTSSTTAATPPPPTGSTAIAHPDNYGCTIDFQFYADGAKVPGDPSKPCELCYCIRNKTACVMQECTLNVEGCQPVYADGVCCPIRYECDYTERPEGSAETTVHPTTGLVLTTTPGPLDCQFDSEVYADGAMLPERNPCEFCYCMKGDIVCAVQECGTPLEKEGKNCTALPPQPGSCCPQQYHCDNGTLPSDDMNQEKHPDEENDVSSEVVQVTSHATPVEPSVNDNEIDSPEGAAIEQMQIDQDDDTTFTTHQPEPVIVETDESQSAAENVPEYKPEHQDNLEGSNHQEHITPSVSLPEATEIAQTTAEFEHEHVTVGEDLGQDNTELDTNPPNEQNHIDTNVIPNIIETTAPEIHVDESTDAPIQKPESDDQIKPEYSVEHSTSHFEENTPQSSEDAADSHASSEGGDTENVEPSKPHDIPNSTIHPESLVTQAVESETSAPEELPQIVTDHISETAGSDAEIHSETTPQQPEDNFQPGITESTQTEAPTALPQAPAEVEEVHTHVPPVSIVEPFGDIEDDKVQSPPVPTEGSAEKESSISSHVTTHRPLLPGESQETTLYSEVTDSPIGGESSSQVTASPAQAVESEDEESSFGSTLTPEVITHVPISSGVETEGPSNQFITAAGQNQEHGSSTSEELPASTIISDTDQILESPQHHTSILPSIEDVTTETNAAEGEVETAKPADVVSVGSVSSLDELIVPEYTPQKPEEANMLTTETNDLTLETHFPSKPETMVTEPIYVETSAPEIHVDESTDAPMQKPESDDQIKPEYSVEHSTSHFEENTPQSSEDAADSHASSQGGDAESVETSKPHDIPNSTIHPESLVTQAVESETSAPEEPPQIVTDHISETAGSDAEIHSETTPQQPEDNFQPGITESTQTEAPTALPQAPAEVEEVHTHVPPVSIVEPFGDIEDDKVQSPPVPTEGSAEKESSISSHVTTHRPLLPGESQETTLYSEVTDSPIGGESSSQVTTSPAQAVESEDEESSFGSTLTPEVITHVPISSGVETEGPSNQFITAAGQNQEHDQFLPTEHILEHFTVMSTGNEIIDHVSGFPSPGEAHEYTSTPTVENTVGDLYVTKPAEQSQEQFTGSEFTEGSGTSDEIVDLPTEPLSSGDIHTEKPETTETVQETMNEEIYPGESSTSPQYHESSPHSSSEYEVTDALLNSSEKPGFVTEKDSHEVSTDEVAVVNQTYGNEDTFVPSSTDGIALEEENTYLDKTTAFPNTPISSPQYEKPTEAISADFGTSSPHVGTQAAIAETSDMTSRPNEETIQSTKAPIGNEHNTSFDHPVTQSPNVEAETTTKEPFTHDSQEDSQNETGEDNKSTEAVEYITSEYDSNIHETTESDHDVSHITNTIVNLPIKPQEVSSAQENDVPTGSSEISISHEVHDDISTEPAINVSEKVDEVTSFEITSGGIASVPTEIPEKGPEGISPSYIKPPHGIVPGEGNCLVEGQTHPNNSVIPPMNPCVLSCRCVSSIVHCVKVACSPPPSGHNNCIPIKDKSDSCCDTYLCDGDSTPTLESDSHLSGTSTPYDEKPHEVSTPPSTGEVSSSISNGFADSSSPKPSDVEKPESHPELMPENTEYELHEPDKIEENEKPIHPDEAPGHDEDTTIESEPIDHSSHPDLSVDGDGSSVMEGDSISQQPDEHPSDELDHEHQHESSTIPSDGQEILPSEEEYSSSHPEPLHTQPTHRPNSDTQDISSASPSENQSDLEQITTIASVDSSAAQEEDQFAVNSGGPSDKPTELQKPSSQTSQITDIIFTSTEEMKVPSVTNAPNVRPTEINDNEMVDNITFKPSHISIESEPSRKPPMDALSTEGYPELSSEDFEEPITMTEHSATQSIPSKPSDDENISLSTPEVEHQAPTLTPAHETQEHVTRYPDAEASPTDEIYAQKPENEYSETNFETIGEQLPTGEQKPTESQPEHQPENTEDSQQIIPEYFPTHEEHESQKPSKEEITSPGPIEASEVEMTETQKAPMEDEETVTASVEVEETDSDALHPTDQLEEHSEDNSLITSAPSAHQSTDDLIESSVTAEQDEGHPLDDISTSSEPSKPDSYKPMPPEATQLPQEIDSITESLPIDSNEQESVNNNYAQQTSQPNEINDVNLPSDIEPSFSKPLEQEEPLYTEKTTESDSAMSHGTENQSNVSGDPTTALPQLSSITNSVHDSSPNVQEHETKPSNECEQSTLSNVEPNIAEVDTTANPQESGKPEGEIIEPIGSTTTSHNLSNENGSNLFMTTFEIKETTVPSKDEETNNISSDDVTQITETHDTVTVVTFPSASVVFGADNISEDVTPIIQTTEFDSSYPEGQKPEEPAVTQSHDHQEIATNESQTPGMIEASVHDSDEQDSIQKPSEHDPEIGSPTTGGEVFQVTEVPYHGSSTGHPTEEHTGGTTEPISVEQETIRPSFTVTVSPVLAETDSAPAKPAEVDQTQNEVPSVAHVDSQHGISSDTENNTDLSSVEHATTPGIGVNDVSKQPPSHPVSQSSESDSSPPLEQKPQFPSHPNPDYENFNTDDGWGYPPTTDEDWSEGSFGPGTCRYGGKLYVSAQQIPRDDPCDFCFCFRSDIICLRQSCPPPIPDCHQEPIEGFCCPRYQCEVSSATVMNVSTTTTTTTTTLPPHFLSHAYNGSAAKTGCVVDGKAFRVGERITAKSTPCLECLCGRTGEMNCNPKDCQPEPMLRKMIMAAANRRR